jgi:hypothetical protein
VLDAPFFAGLNDTSATLATLRNVSPGEEAEILRRAAAVAHGEVAVFGHGLLQVGTPPIWNRDPVAGRSAPSGHWSRIPYLNPHVVGDHKVIWEINRHQYFITLGQAWLYSKDERWPKLFVQHVRSWLAENPPTIGINWASSLEVSYRAIAWIWALRLMGDAPGITDTVAPAMIESLAAHGKHLARYLSTYFSPNTHLTGEALGLLYIGTQCPMLADAEEWRRLGSEVLERSLAQQVLADGVYFEQATQYHRYTIEIYLHYLLLTRATSMRQEGKIESSLHRMYDVLLALTRPDGTIPLIGDDDGGRLLPVDARAPDDVRSLLAVGAVLLGRSDLAWVGRGDDAMLCWLLGPTSPESRDALLSTAPAARSIAFTEGGLYVMRDGWDSAAGHLTVDAGPHGALSYGHSHADALSVGIAVGGRPLFVDAGTFTYVGPERDAFRTTAAHNTVEIDGQSACVPSTAFRWQDVSHPKSTNWIDQEAFTFFSGVYDGYARLDAPLTLQRSVLQPTRGVWIIRDDLVGLGEHDAVVRWHCAPGLRAEAIHPHEQLPLLKVSRGADPQAVVAMLGSARCKIGVEPGAVSPQYGRIESTDVITAREHFTGNATVVSVVIDCARFAIDFSPERVRSAVGAFAALPLQSLGKAESEHFTLLVGGASPMAIGNLEIDASLVWLAHASSNRTAHELTAVGVRALRDGTLPLLTPDVLPSWVVASEKVLQDGANWQVRAGRHAPLL